MPPKKKKKKKESVAKPLDTKDMKVQCEAYEDDKNAAYGAILSAGLGGTGALLTADEYISRVKAAEEQMDEVAAMRRRKGKR